MYKKGIINYAQELLKYNKYTTITRVHNSATGIAVEIEIDFKDNNLKGYFTGSKMSIITKNNFIVTFTKGIPVKVKELYIKTKEEL